jgi:hypothetical protein
MHKEVELQTIGGDNNRSKVQLANMQFVISKRLIADLPLVPTNNLIYSLVDDMQVGLYEDLGDINNCDANWDEWLQRTVDILKAEGYLGESSIMINRPAITTTAANDNIRPFIMEMFDEDDIPNEVFDKIDDVTLNEINNKAWQEAFDDAREHIDVDGLSDEDKEDKIQYSDYFCNKYPSILKQYILEKNSCKTVKKHRLHMQASIDFEELEADYNIGESNGVYTASINYGVKVPSETPDELYAQFKSFSKDELINYLGADKVYETLLDIANEMSGDADWLELDENELLHDTKVEDIKEVSDGVEVWFGYTAFSDYIDE